MSDAPPNPTSQPQRRKQPDTATTTRSQPQKTRQRMSLSCMECRRLKLKCDRNFPCASCRRRGCENICPTGVRKPPGRALEIQAEFSLLAKRVEYLENLVTELGSADRIPPPLKLQHASKKTSSFLKELEAQIEHASNMNGSDDDAGSDEDLKEEASETEDEAKLVIGVGSLSIGADEGTRYLGASAAPAYFFEEDDQEEEQHIKEEPEDDKEGHPVVSLGPGARGNEEVENYRQMLPPYEEATALSRNYFDFLAFQFIPISENQYFNDYLPSSYTPNDPSPTKLGAVYIIISLGMLFDPKQPATFNADAQRYFLRSQNVLAAAKALSNNTLATLQNLLLCGSFLLCQHNLKEGGETFFPFLGIASRLLVTQALHRDGKLFGMQEGEELNRRRRVFWEFTTIERMQAYISGRPYILQDFHFDTKYPTDASAFDVAKWRLGTLIGKIVDQAFSIASPSYSTILKLDEELRNLVRDSPESLRSGVLPSGAFLEKPQIVPQMPAPTADTEEPLLKRLQQHTMDQMFSQVLFFVHKPAFANAILHNPKEPLESPYRASVEAVALETGVYLVAVAKSWTNLHPILCPRWWHIHFHAFAAAVSQATLVIKSPSSLLAPHSWTQLKEAVTVFEIAGSTGAPCSQYIPRLKLLQEKAYVSLQNLLSVPLGLGSHASSESLVEGEITRSILNPSARLERKPIKGKSTSPAGSSPTGSASASVHTQSSTSSHLAHSAAAREPPRPREVSRPQEVYRSHEVPDHRFEAPIYSNSDPSLSAPPVVPLPPQQQYLYSEVGGTTHLPLGPQSLGEPSYQANSYQPMPSYHSSAPAYPPEPFSRPLETYSYLPVESCMEFGGFATEYPASQEWVPSDQVYAQSGGHYPIEPSAYPSHFDFTNYAPPPQ